MTAVEGDDQVVAGEVRVRELPSTVSCPVIAVAVQRVDRALVGPLADVPVTGAGAGRGDAVAETRGIREPPEDDVRHRRAADVAGAHEHDVEGLHGGRSHGYILRRSGGSCTPTADFAFSPVHRRGI